MEILVFLIVIVSIIASAANKRKEAQRKQGSRDAQTAQARHIQQVREAEQQRTPTSGARANNAPMQPTIRQTPIAPRVSTPQSGSMVYSSTEGMAAGSTEGMYSTQGRPTLATDYNRPRHIVTPSSESGHAHMESSITGVTDCSPNTPPVEFEHEDAYAGTAQKLAGLNLDVSKNAIVQGIVLSEVLGKPRAMKRYSRA